MLKYPPCFEQKAGEGSPPASPPTTPHISPALKPARPYSRPGGEGGGLEFGMLDVGLGIIGGGGGVGIWRR